MVNVYLQINLLQIYSSRFTPLLSWSWSEPRWIILVLFSRCQTGLCQSPTLYFILVKPCSLEGCWVWFIEGSQSSGASNWPIKNWSSKTLLVTFNCLVDYYGAVLVFTLLNPSFLFSPVLRLCSCIWKAPQWALRLPQHRPVIDTSERL